jgi:hypothetical protein
MEFNSYDYFIDDLVKSINYIKNQGWYIQYYVFKPENKSVCMLFALYLYDIQYKFKNTYAREEKSELINSILTKPIDNFLFDFVNNKYSIQLNITQLIVLYMELSEQDFRDKSNINYIEDLKLCNYIKKKITEIDENIFSAFL